MAQVLTSATSSVIDLTPGGEVVLGGLMSTGLSLAVSTELTQRFFVQGLASLRLYARVSAISSTAQGTDLRIFAVHDATFDRSGTREVTPLGATSVSVANDTDGILSVSLNGIRMVEASLVRSASSGCTLGLIVLGGQPD